MIADLVAVADRLAEEGGIALTFIVGVVLGGIFVVALVRNLKEKQ